MPLDSSGTGGFSWCEWWMGDVLILHHQLLLSAGQVDADKQARSPSAGGQEVLVVNGIEELGEVHMAAQGIGHPAVSQGTQGAVELQVMEPHEVLLPRRAPEDPQ